MGENDVRLMMTFWTLLALCLGALPVHAADGDAIVGVWNTANKDAKIEIYPCGTKYCGRIAELMEPNFSPDDNRGMAGLPRVDRNNPDPQLRDRPLVGLTLIEGFRYTGDHIWKGGRIYNPEDGKRYQAKITLPAPNRLKLRGFLGISLLGRTETWTR